MARMALLSELTLPLVDERRHEPLLGLDPACAAFPASLERLLINVVLFTHRGPAT